MFNKYKDFCLPFFANGLFIADCDNFVNLNYFYAKQEAFTIMA